MSKIVRFIWEHLIPRFLTEDVAVERIAAGEGWDKFKIVCCMDDVQPGEVFDGIATVDSFSWLGFGFCYTISNFRNWNFNKKA